MQSGKLEEDQTSDHPWLVMRPGSTEAYPNYMLSGSHYEESLNCENSRMIDFDELVQLSENGMKLQEWSKETGFTSITGRVDVMLACQESVVC